MVLDRFGQVVAHSRAPGAVGSTLSDPVSLRALAAGPCSRRRSARTGRRSTTSRCRSWSTAAVGHRADRPLAPRWTPRSPAPGGSWPRWPWSPSCWAAWRRRSSPGGSPGPVRQLADGVAAIARGELDQRIDPGAPTSSAGWRSRSTTWPPSSGSSGRTSRSPTPTLHQRFAELSDLKSYTDHILRSFVNGLVTLDLDGRVVTLNAAAEALTGCAAPAQGRPATEVFPHLPGAPGPAPRDAPDRGGGPALAPCAAARRAAAPGRGRHAPLRGAEGTGPRRGGRPPGPDRRSASWRSSSAAPTGWPRWAPLRPGWPTRSRTRSPRS